MLSRARLAGLDGNRRGGSVSDCGCLPQSQTSAEDPAKPITTRATEPLVLASVSRCEEVQEKGKWVWGHEVLQHPGGLAGALSAPPFHSFFVDCEGDFQIVWVIEDFFRLNQWHRLGPGSSPHHTKWCVDHLKMNKILLALYAAIFLRVEALGARGWLIGLILALDGIAAVLQGEFFPALVKRNSPQKLLRIAFLLQAVGLASIPFARHLWLLIPLNALFGIGVGLASPTINALASQLAAPERQGIVFGWLQSARSVGFLFGPIIGGALFDLAYSLPYLLVGGLALFAAAIGYDPSRKSFTLRTP